MVYMLVKRPKRVAGAGKRKKRKVHRRRRRIVGGGWLSNINNWLKDNKVISRGANALADTLGGPWAAAAKGVGGVADSLGYGKRRRRRRRPRFLGAGVFPAVMGQRARVIF